VIELTEQEQHAVDAEATPRLIDPRDRKAYVLVAAEIFDRFRSFLSDDEPDMRQVATLVEEAMHDDDAGDPTLPYYQAKYGPKS